MTPINPLTFLILALSTWRITRLFVSEVGPFAVFHHIRETAKRFGAGHASLYTLMTCRFCLSLWVAMPLALLLTTDIIEWIVYTTALSGASLMLGTFTGIDYGN